VVTAVLLYSQPLNSSIINRVKSLQTTIQIGLWTTADDVEHSLLYPVSAVAVLVDSSYHNHHTTTVLWPFLQDHPGEPVPEENFWTFWCKGRLTEAETLTIQLGATPSRLTVGVGWLGFNGTFNTE